jgi:hypothetical protein
MKRIVYILAGLLIINILFAGCASYDRDYTTWIKTKDDNNYDDVNLEQLLKLKQVCGSQARKDNPDRYLFCNNVNIDHEIKSIVNRHEIHIRWLPLNPQELRQPLLCMPQTAVCVDHHKEHPR